MIYDDEEVKKQYARKISIARGSFARTRDTTKECLLDVTLIACCKQNESRQLREYICDKKSLYTDDKLHG